MYKQCTTEATTQKQRNLEMCFLELLKTNSYDSITVSSICALANVPRGMFYRYFDSKADALDALIDHTLLEYLTDVLLAAKPETDDPMGLKALLTYWKSQKPLLDVLRKEHMETLLFARSLHCCINEEPLLSQHLRFAGHPATPEVIAFCTNGIVSAIFLWYYSGFEKSVEEMAGILFRLLSGPVVKMCEAE